MNMKKVKFKYPLVVEQIFSMEYILGQFSSSLPRSGRSGSTAKIALVVKCAEHWSNSRQLWPSDKRPLSAIQNAHFADHGLCFDVGNAFIFECCSTNIVRRSAASLGRVRRWSVTVEADIAQQSIADWQLDSNGSFIMKSPGIRRSAFKSLASLKRLPDRRGTDRAAN